MVASPTFGLPEGKERKKKTRLIIQKKKKKAIGGPRNWDYRYAWIRDSSFTIYAFLRLGFTKEAGQFMKYIEERCNDLVLNKFIQLTY